MWDTGGLTEKRIERAKEDTKAWPTRQKNGIRKKYKVPDGWDTKKRAHGSIHKDGVTRYGGKKYTENTDQFYRTKSGNAYKPTETRNKRDVWTVATAPFKEAHFATFPPELIKPCILAGSPEGGTVLDPFIGSGTVGVKAKQLWRNFVGIDISNIYIKDIAEPRLKEVTTLFDYGEG